MEVISLAMFMIFASPVVFIAGIIVTITSKTNQKIGKIMIGSLISFIIGFGICSNVSIGGGH
jgi:hypothetical protein